MATITAEYRIPRNRVKQATQIAQWDAILVAPTLLQYFDLFPLLFVSSTTILDPGDPLLLLRTLVLTPTPLFLIRWGSSARQIIKAYQDVGFRQLYAYEMQTTITEAVNIT